MPMAKPYTGQQLLDDTYGLFWPRPVPTVRRCRCGKPMVVGDASIAETTCSRECHEAFMAAVHRDCIPVAELIRISSLERIDGRRSQFFANRWWELDRFGERLRPETDAKRIARLNRLKFGERKPEVKPPRLQSYDRPELSASRPNRTRKSTPRPKASCSCTSQALHDSVPDPTGSATYCPLHKTACNTCGHDHYELVGVPNPYLA